jgi:ABC-type proline/glycine betaine transport system permease subunit
MDLLIGVLALLLTLLAIFLLQEFLLFLRRSKRRRLIILGITLTVLIFPIIVGWLDQWKLDLELVTIGVIVAIAVGLFFFHLPSRRDEGGNKW